MKPNPSVKIKKVPTRFTSIFTISVTYTASKQFLPLLSWFQELSLQPSYGFVCLSTSHRIECNGNGVTQPTVPGLRYSEEAKQPWWWMAVPIYNSNEHLRKKLNYLGLITAAQVSQSFSSCWSFRAVVQLFCGLVSCIQPNRLLYNCMYYFNNFTLDSYKMYVHTSVLFKYGK